MTDDSLRGLLSRLKGIFRGAFYSQIPDHPSHGGNTGDSEWTPADAKQAREQAESETADRENP